MEIFSKLLLFPKKCGKIVTVLEMRTKLRTLFEERIELMRKAKIAAMIFGGVSTCICGGILGVYSGTTTVGTVAPKNNVENIYDVQSEKLANVAAVTSIKTTAVTTTSKVPTTLSVVNDFSVDEQIAEIYSAITTTAPITESTETTVSNEIYADYAESVDDDDTDNNDNFTYTASFGNLTISGPFIATEEPETTTAVETEVPAETTTEVEAEVPAEITTEVPSETITEVEEEFVFEPSTEYYPPAVEYIAPVPETTETTATTTADTTTEATTTTSESTTTTTTADTTTIETITEYVITTDEYTVPTSVAEETTTIYETTTETTTAEVTTTEVSTTTETTTTTEITTTTSETTTETTTTTDMMTIDVDTTVSSLPITDEEYVLLCNCVANEAGSDWIDVYEKGKVVEVIMNRVNSPLYPNTIYEVITAPYQFTGSENYAYLTTYSGYVTNMVQEAVDLYFNEPSSFTHNYFGFYGDGYQNHFY